MIGFDVYDSPGYLIRRAHQAVVAVFAEETAGEVTPVQFGILALLVSGERLDLSTLAERMALDPSTSGETVNRLVAKGWVEREADPDDRRRKLIRISEVGRALFQRQRDAVASVQALVLEGLTPDEREGLLRGLRKLVRVQGGAPRPDAE